MCMDEVKLLLQEDASVPSSVGSSKKRRPSPDSDAFAGWSLKLQYWHGTNWLRSSGLMLLDGVSGLHGVLTTDAPIWYYFRYLSGWWFGIFIFPYIRNKHPNWLIFFRWVQTTNQLYYLIFQSRIGEWLSQISLGSISQRKPSWSTLDIGTAT